MCIRDRSQTAEFLNNYAITLEDERNQGVVTYIFDEKNYKRYQDGNVISEDGWRFTNLGKLRVFSGDIKLTWKFKLDKQNVIVIKTKFQPRGWNLVLITITFCLSSLNFHVNLMSPEKTLNLPKFVNLHPSSEMTFPSWYLL